MAERITGLGSLRARFSDLKTSMPKKTALRMVAAGSSVLKKEARRLAASKGLRLTGALDRNIAIKREKTPEGLAQYNLGVRHGRHLGRKAERRLKVGRGGRVVSFYVNDPFYWWYLEKGRNVYHGNGKRRNGVRSRVDGTPFIAPALENKGGEAISAMEKRAQQDILKDQGR